MRSFWRKGIFRHALGQLVAAAGSLLFLLGGQAFASDFKITVPLEISNLPAGVKGVNVNCELYAGNQKVGETSKFAARQSDGSIQDEMPFDFNAPGGVDPASVDRYVAWFTLFGSNGNALPNESGKPWAKTKPGTEVVQKVEGNLGGGPSRAASKAFQKFP